jgi:hypothetical protein
MMVALANPVRFTDAQRDQIVARYNAPVMAAGQSGQTETVDVAQVHRETVEAGADPSKLTGEQRAELLRRYDRATREQQPTARGQARTWLSDWRWHANRRSAARRSTSTA